MEWIMTFIWNLIIDLFNNNVLLVAILSWFVSQVAKTIINFIVTREFRWERLIGDGGMPSGHSATVSACAAMCAWTYGFDSAVFGVAFVLAIVVMHDASGVRREAGKHAVVIKEIAEVVNHLDEGKQEEIATDKLKEFVGHTHAQVIVGCILGIIVTIVFCLIFQVGYASGAPVVVIPDVV